MIVLDPGLGFAKLAGAQLGAAGQPGPDHPPGRPGAAFPVLIGASRKRFLGRLLAAPDGTPRPFAAATTPRSR